MTGLAAAFCDTLSQDGTLTNTFEAMPGKCYQVLAQGFQGVQDVAIVVQPTNPTPCMPALSPVAQSSTTGPDASSSSSGSCYHYPFPIAAEHLISAQVVGGCGRVAVRIYEK